MSDDLWLPMKTAPKDERDVILRFERDGEVRYSLASWRGDEGWQCYGNDSICQINEGQTITGWWPFPGWVLG